MYSKLCVFRIILFKGFKVFCRSWFLATPGTRGKNKELRGSSHFLGNYNVFQQHRYSSTKQVNYSFVPPSGNLRKGSFWFNQRQFFEERDSCDPLAANITAAGGCVHWASKGDQNREPTASTAVLFLRDLPSPLC